jgi:hypothetical protein
MSKTHGTFNTCMSDNTWDRKPDEPAKAWAAFVEYRDQGAGRALRRVGQKLGVARQLVERWSRDWTWAARCRDYEAHQDAIRQQETQAELVTIARRNAVLTMLAQTKIREAMKLLDPTMIDPDKLPQWLRALSYAESNMRGAPVYQLQVSGPGGKPIEHEHTVAMRQAEQSLAGVLGAVLVDETEDGMAAEPDE